MLFVWIGISILATIAFWMAVWILISFLVGKSRRQKQFVTGTAPTNGPDGFYKGSAYLMGGRLV